MKTKKFAAISIPIMVALAGIAIGGSLTANFFRDSLDTYLGQGEKVFEGTSGDLDGNFYNPQHENTVDGKIAAALDASKIAEEISDEGEVLLKNDGVLPLAKQSLIAPLGYHYVAPTMTGVGSGAATLIQDFVVKPADALKRYFNVNEAFESVMSSAKAEHQGKNGISASGEDKGTFGGATHTVPEYNPSIYRAGDVRSEETALLFLGRQGGEGDDLYMGQYKDNGGNEVAKHQLQLMPHEKNMIAFAKANFGKVVVIVNSPNPLELGSLQNDGAINAILWVGTTGSRGFESMAKILCGDINPSGHLADTYAADFTEDPTYVNFGDFHYFNHDGDGFVEYEEGIYVGYKYFETRYGASADYANHVVYPFGYGLHYEDNLVSQSLDTLTYDESQGTISVSGHIDNNSSRDVMESVQIYYSAPYYGGMGKSNIEKASKNLLDFKKIEVKAGEKNKQFSFTFSDEELASYDYKGFYSGGKGSYVLEKGEYTIYLGDDAHASFGEKTFELAKNKVYLDVETKSADSTYYAKRESDGIPATNVFQYVNEYMTNSGTYGEGNDVTLLSRSDDFASFSSSPAFLKMASQAVLDQIAASDQGVDYSEKIKALFGEELPVSGEQNGITLSQMRGIDYDSPLWETFMNQLVYEDDGLAEINKLLGNGAFNTNPITALGKGKTNESDGPQAIGKTGMSDGTGAACCYPAEVVVASTWSKELARKMGNSIGEEALAQNSNGWYAPACNIHRSPFAGRVYEYYSEDGVLSGVMARYVLEGASEKGYTPYLKHFALNEQEFGRMSLITWADEQAIREIYLKPFEIAVKQAEITEKYYAQNSDGSYSLVTRQMKGATGMMTSMNRIGGLWTGTNYSLTTTLLRDEWGFQGCVITDSVTPINGQLVSSLAAGNDFYLTFMNSKLTDSTSSYARWGIRKSIKNICYTVCNSNAMQGLAPGASYHYAMSPWWWAVIGLDSACGIGILVLGTFLVLHILKDRKQA